MNEKKSKWAVEAEEFSTNLSDLLAFASANYGKHTDWFLRHKDTGIKILAVLLTAELTVTSLYLTRHFHDLVTMFTLIILSLLSIILTAYSLISCRQSYKASLENALLITKTLWAMGLTKAVKVKTKEVDFSKCPVHNDETPYVPRYLNDAVEKEDSNSFINHHLSKRGTTYYAAKCTIIIFGIIVFLTGIGSTIAIIFWRV